MTARDFLDLAKELAEENQPAKLRSALGRAYYAVYNSAAECQKNMGFSLYTGQSSGRNHSLVRDRFGYVVTDNVKALYRDMKDLHDMRKCADYDLADADAEDIETVKAHVELAEEVLGFIEGITSSSSIATIIQEIGDYDRNNPTKRP